MATLSYAGRSPDRDAVVVPKSYADTAEAAQALTITWVNNQIAATTPLLTVQSYVDTQDALRAHQTDVTTADGNYVAAAARSATNGVAALDSLGNLPSAQLPSGILTDRVAKSYSMLPTVAFEAVGTAPGYAFGTTGSPTTVNGTHNSAGGTNTVVLAYVFTIPNGSSVTGVGATVTYGGVAMTEWGLPQRGAFGGSGSIYNAVYYLFNPPSGAKTVATVLSATGVSSWFTTVQTVSYTNVASLGTLAVQSDFTGTSAIETLSSTPCPPGGVVSVGLMCSSGTGAGTINNFNQITRFDNNNTSSLGLYVVIGESAVADNITFSATMGVAQYWGVLGVPLNPGGGLSTQIGALNFSGSWTATGSAVRKLANIVVPDPGYPWRAIPMAWVWGDSSGSTRPANRSVGTGSYGLLTVVPSAGGQVYGAGGCTGSFSPGFHTVVPYGAPGQTPSSVPPLNGSVELDLVGQLWSGTTFTFYATKLTYFILVFPAL